MDPVEIAILAAQERKKTKKSVTPTYSRDKRLGEGGSFFTTANPNYVSPQVQAYSRPLVANSQSRLENPTLMLALINDVNRRLNALVKRSNTPGVRQVKVRTEKLDTQKIAQNFLDYPETYKITYNDIQNLYKDVNPNLKSSILISNSLRKIVFHNVLDDIDEVNSFADLMGQKRIQEWRFAQHIFKNRPFGMITPVDIYVAAEEINPFLTNIPPPTPPPTPPPAPPF